MSAPALLRETAVVYRCPFCRRSWRSQAKKVASRHLVHCFARPDRVPYVGELSDTTGVPLRFRGNDRTFPEWWPGEGKIFDGRTWRNVPGYEPNSYERWPKLRVPLEREGSGVVQYVDRALEFVKPWALRLEVLPGVCLDELRLYWTPYGESVGTYANCSDDTRVIAAVADCDGEADAT